MTAKRSARRIHIAEWQQVLDTTIVWLFGVAVATSQPTNTAKFISDPLPETANPVAAAPGSVELGPELAMPPSSLVPPAHS